MIGCNRDLRRLTLGLVDRHSESRFDWELEPGPIEGEFPRLWNEDYPWDQYSPVGSGQFTLEDLVEETSLEDELGPVA